ncbi:MAG: hypothetical protein IKM34_06770 [Clostridia bacterium]|nr:hypothetical protein [Clostridia bacterium]
MFGYVRPRRSELKIKEFDYYRTVYCGLCHAEKKLSRRLRYSLSYDMVALALCRIGATGEQSTFQKCRCVAHPMKGRYCVACSPSLSYTASVAAILVYYKLLDDKEDEKGFRRLGARFMLGGARRAMKASPIPALNTLTKEKLDALYAAERAGAESVYEGASLFGELLGEIFAFDEGDTLSKDKKICLYEIGNRLGRFIYIVDAYADIAEDQKEGKYNPFVLSGEDTNDESFTTALINALDMELAAALNALDLLSVEDPGIDSIIRNILAMGLPDVAEKVILKKEKMKTPKEPRHE